jgi:large subunit ribosomal protein L4
VPKKKKIVALRQLLGFKKKQGQLFILESPQLPEPKTRFFVGPFVSFLSPHKTALLVLTKHEEALFRAARNIPWAKTMSISGFNLFDLAKYEAVVFSKETIPELSGRLQWMESSIRS